jgi:hypothetical protein
LDLSGNTPLVELVSLDTAGVGQPRRVQDADLGKRLSILITFTNARIYYNAVVAHKFVKADRVGLTLVVRIISLVGMVENVEVIVINLVAGKGIGDKFQY